MTVLGEVQESVGEFTASDGYVHHYRQWSAAPQPRGIIVSLHGIQSHSGWYGWSSARLAAAGYEVRFLDRRGSGLNKRNRDHAESASRLMADVVEFLALAAQPRNASRLEMPVILSAVSWGAKLAAVVAAESPEMLDALLLLYPAIRTQMEPRWWQAAAIRGANGIGLGKRQIAIPLTDAALFTDSLQWQTFIQDDPLALHRVSFSFLKATLQLTTLADRAAFRIACPTLVMLAGRDQIVDVPAMRDWSAGLAGDALLIEYPTARHTLEFDADRERFVADAINWIESQR